MSGQLLSASPKKDSLSTFRARTSTRSTRAPVPGFGLKKAAQSNGHSSSSWSPSEDSAEGNNNSMAVSDGQSEQQSESEAESEYKRPKRRSRQRRAGARRRSQAGGSAGGTDSAAAAAEAAGGGQTAESSQSVLHAPHSHLLWCDTTVNQRGTFFVSQQLCTDIEGMSSSSSSSADNGDQTAAAIQLTVVVHPASWDVQQYVRTQLQLEAPPAQQLEQTPASAGAGSAEEILPGMIPGPRSAKVFGPYAATLKLKGTSLYVSNIQHQHEQQTCRQYLDRKPHRVVVQERVPGAGPPHFKLHLKPGQPAHRHNQYGQVVSRAGEAPGLQVPPGSVQEVHVVRFCSYLPNQPVFYVPKLLCISQLPVSVVYPLAISIRVVGYNQQWSARLAKDLRVTLGKHHPLSALASCSISKMSLSQDHVPVLTLTLAAGAAPAAAAGAPAATAAPRAAPGAPPGAALAALVAAAAGPATAPAAPARLANGTEGTATGDRCDMSSPAGRPVGAVLGAGTLTRGTAATAAAPTGAGPAAGLAVNPLVDMSAAAAAGGGGGMSVSVTQSMLKRRSQQQAPAVTAAAAAAGASGLDLAQQPSNGRATKKPKHAALQTPPAAAAAVEAPIEAPAAVPATEGPLPAERALLQLPPASAGRFRPQQAAEHLPAGTGGVLDGGSRPPAAPSPAAAAAAAANAVTPGPLSAPSPAAGAGPAAAAAAARRGACVKFEKLEIIDVAADDDDSDGAGANTAAAAAAAQAQQAAPAAPNASMPGPLIQPTPTRCGAKPAAAAAAAAAAAGGRGAPVKFEHELVELAADDDGDVVSADAMLPAGLQLPDADSASQMQVHLVRLMSRGVKPLLPDQQFVDLMKQLRVFFEPSKQAAVDSDQLQCKYMYLQAAVMGRQLDEVLTVLQQLLAL